MISDTRFILPDLFAHWPFPRAMNPYNRSASDASGAWVESYHALDDKGQAAFNRCKFGVLASLAYPHAEPTHLRLSCDLMNWFFIFDELSDVQDGVAVRNLGDLLMDVFRDPSETLRSPDQPVLVQMTQSFWSRVLEFATPSSAKRFITSVEPYIQAVYQEAEDRQHHHVRSIEDYLTLRRGSVGARPSLDFISLAMDLPEDVTSHPSIEGLVLGAIELIILVNDMYSYNFERSRGLDGHNIVSVVAKEKNLGIQDAIYYVGEMYNVVAKKFLEGMEDLPSFSESIDPLVSEYVFGLGNWITALLEWSFESERYFGTLGQDIKSSRIVELLPSPCR